MLNLRGYCSTGAQGGHASGVCGTDGGARGGTSVTGLVAAENAEDGRTTADDAEQAFHRAVGGQREHKPIIGQFRCLSCRFKADYDAWQLAFDSPWVYRSNYSFDLIN